MRLLHLVLVTIVVTSLAVPATAQQRDNLTGIGPIRVVIEDLRPDIEVEGLTRTMLQTAVELRLRRNGVPLADSVSLFLYVRVNAGRRQGSGMFAYSTDVQLNTPVEIIATGRTANTATIWSHSEVGTVGADKVRQIRDSLLDYVDRFSNDYLAVNPR